MKQLNQIIFPFLISLALKYLLSPLIDWLSCASPVATCLDRAGSGPQQYGGRRAAASAVPCATAATTTTASGSVWARVHQPGVPEGGAHPAVTFGGKVLSRPRRLAEAQAVELSGGDAIEN